MKGPPGEVHLRRLQQLSGDEAMTFVVRAYAELQRDGQADATVCMIQWDDKAVLASDGQGRPIGLITFCVSDWRRELAIKIGFVETPWRSRGVYRRLWNELVTWGGEAGVGVITGVVKTDNHAMRATAKALGRREESINLEYRLDGS